MKSIVTQFFLLAFAGTTLFAEVSDPKGVFSEANQFYEAGEYVKAIEQYRFLLDDDQSPSVLYNLANAYYQQEDYAQAILYYEKARALAPKNPDVRANLSLARVAAQLQQPNPPWYQRLAWTQSVTVWIWLSVISFWLGLACILLPPLWGKRGPIRSGMIALCILVFAVSAFSLAGYHQIAKLGVSISDDTALKLSPTSNAPARQYLKPGESASIERSHGDYFYVHTSTGREGWVSSESFKPIWD